MSVVVGTPPIEINEPSPPPKPDEKHPSINPELEAERNSKILGMFDTCKDRGCKLDGMPIKIVNPVGFVDCLKDKVKDNIRNHLNSTGQQSVFWGANKLMDDNALKAHITTQLNEKCPGFPSNDQQKLVVQTQANFPAEVRWSKTQSNTFNCAVSFLAPYAIGDATEFKQQQNLIKPPSGGDFVSDHRNDGKSNQFLRMLAIAAVVTGIVLIAKRK